MLESWDMMQPFFILLQSLRLKSGHILNCTQMTKPLHTRVVASVSTDVQEKQTAFCNVFKQHKHAVIYDWSTSNVKTSTLHPNLCRSKNIHLLFLLEYIYSCIWCIHYIKMFKTDLWCKIITITKCFFPIICSLHVFEHCFLF